MLLYGSMSSMTVRFERGIGVTADSIGRDRRMRVLNGGMKLVVKPGQEYELTGFLVKIQVLVELKRVPLLVYYSSDISEAENMSVVRHVVAVSTQ